MVKSKHRFLSADDYKKIQSQFEYFDAVQLTMILLIAEYDHAISSPEEVVKKDFDTYFKNREAQLAVKPKIIPNGALVETTSELMIYPCDIWNVYKSIKEIHYLSTHDTSVDLYRWISLDRTSDLSYNVNYTPGWSSRDRIRPTSTGKPLLGFKNWRMPSCAEADKMFKGWKGKGLGTWAVSQGYPRDYINDNMKIYLVNGSIAHSYILFTKNGQVKSNPLNTSVFN